MTARLGDGEELAEVVELRGRPFCGACRRPLQHKAQFRCPWQGCRRWFRDPSASERKT